MRNSFLRVASRTAQMTILMVVAVLTGFVSNAYGYTAGIFKGLPVVWSGQCGVNDPHCPDEAGAATVGAERWRERRDNHKDGGACYAYVIGLSDTLAFQETGPATDVSLNYGLAGTRATNMMDALVSAGLPAQYVRSWWVQRSNVVGQRFQGVSVMCENMEPNALARQLLEKAKADMAARVQVAVRGLPNIDPQAALWAISGSCGGVVKFSAEEGGWQWPTHGQECTCGDEIPLESNPWREAQALRSQVPQGTVVSPAWRDMVCDTPPNLVWDTTTKVCREPTEPELLGVVNAAHVATLNSQDFVLTVTAMKRVLAERFSQIGTYESTGFVEYRVESTCEAYERELLADAWDDDFKFRVSPLFMGSVLGGSEWTTHGGTGAGYGGGNLEVGLVIGNGHYAGVIGVGGSSFYRECDDTGELGVEGLLGFRLGSGNDFGFSGVYRRYEGMVFLPELVNSSTGKATSQSGRSSVRNAVQLTLDIHPTDRNWYVGLGVEAAARVQVVGNGDATSMFGLAPVVEVGTVGWRRDNPFRSEATWR